MTTQGEISWARYVPYERVERYEALGWEKTDGFSKCHHGVWSCLMTWHGEGEPPEPKGIGRG